jgi:hypothetical protein
VHSIGNHAATLAAYYEHLQASLSSDTIEQLWLIAKDFFLADRYELAERIHKIIYRISIQSVSVEADINTRHLLIRQSL